MSATSSKPPCTTRARSPKGASRARAAATASASRSMPRSRRSGRASRRRRACPPPPTVASTTSPGGTGARSSTTSRPITGRCSKPLRPDVLAVSPERHRRVLPTSPPDGECRSVFSPNRLGGSGRSGGFTAPIRGAGGRPAAGLEASPVVSPSFGRVRSLDDVRSDRRSRLEPAVQRRPTAGLVLAPPRRGPRSRCGRRRPRRPRSRSRPAYSRRVGGMRDPALLVGRDLAGAGEEGPGRVELVAPRFDCSRICSATARTPPACTRPGSRPGPWSTTAPSARLVPELGREDHPTLRVQGVLELPQEHGLRVPSLRTSPDTPLGRWTAPPRTTPLHFVATLHPSPPPVNPPAPPHPTPLKPPRPLAPCRLAAEPPSAARPGRRRAPAPARARRLERVSRSREPRSAERRASAHA